MVKARDSIGTLGKGTRNEERTLDIDIQGSCQEGGERPSQKRRMCPMSALLAGYTNRGLGLGFWAQHQAGHRGPR